MSVAEALPSVDWLIQI